jgi:hypothetical protein
MMKKEISRMEVIYRVKQEQSLFRAFWLFPKVVLQMEQHLIVWE